MPPQTPQRRSQSIDGVRPARQAGRPVTIHNRPVSRPIDRSMVKQPQPTPQQVEKSMPLWKRSLKKLFQLFLFLCLIIFALLVQSPMIGQLAVLVYAVVALIFRFSSRTTFILAIMSFLLVLLASARSDVNLAQTFSAYAFLLLVVGTISLAREVRSEI